MTGRSGRIGLVSEGGRTCVAGLTVKVNATLFA